MLPNHDDTKLQLAENYGPIKINPSQTKVTNLSHYEFNLPTVSNLYFKSINYA